MSIEKKIFCYRMHSTGGKTILAVCDAGLAGKTIKSKYLDFHVSEYFYGTEQACASEIIQKVKEAGIVNVVGKDIVQLLVGRKLVDEGCILWMGETPHVQIVQV
jgi:hypothetical protein